MNFYEFERDDGALAVHATVTGRLADGGVRFVFWAPLAMIGLSLLFTPDYVCQYREQQPVPGLFWAVMAAAAGVIAAVAGFVRFARRDSWIFDATAGKIAFRADPLVGPSAEATVDLTDWTKIEARAVGPGRVSGVAIGIDGRPDELVCTSRFGWTTVAEVFDELRAFARKHDLEVDIEKRES